MGKKCSLHALPRAITLIPTTPHWKNTAKNGHNVAKKGEKGSFGEDIATERRKNIKFAQIYNKNIAKWLN